MLGARQLVVCLPDDEPERSRVGRALARELVELTERAPTRRRGWLIEQINGQPAAEHAVSGFLLDEGFASTALGLQLRVARGRADESALDGEPFASDEAPSQHAADA